MFAVAFDSRARRWRAVAVVAASLVPAAMDVLRTLAQGERVELRAVVTSTSGVLLLLALLTATFDFAMRRHVAAARCFVLCAAVALGIGVLESLSARGIDRA